MDTKDLLSRLKQQFPSVVLEVRPFGRYGRTILWIELLKVRDLAVFLKQDPSTGLDWLECLDATDIEGTIILTYFLRSSQESAKELILRGSLVPQGTESEVTAISVVDLWPTARRLEQEASELLGIRFVGNEQAAKALLPQDWGGFPLRKSYLFPAEFQGILHMRPAGQTAPDEHGVLQ